MKLDVLDGCKEIKVCKGYRYGGKLYRDMPSDIDVLTDCEPVYEVLAGWTTETTGISSYGKLPRAAKRYLERIQELVRCPIDMISTGSRRKDTILLRNPFKRAHSRIKVPRRRS